MDQRREVLERLDLAAEFRELGVEIVGKSPSPLGWIACRAHGRTDSNPSAGINIKSGQYKDHAGEKSISIFDLAVKAGRFPDFKAAFHAYAVKAGITLTNGNKSAFEPLPWNDGLIGLWCLKKPGVTLDAVRAAGGGLCRHYKDICIQLPIYLAGQIVGRVLYNSNGLDLPIFAGKAKEPVSRKKIKTLAGSDSGFLGKHGLDHLAGSDLVWKVEGPSDMLCLWGNIPRELETSHVVITNSGGCGENPKPANLKIFAGKKVAVVGDADTPGQDGARKWAEALARVSAEVRLVTLPYDVMPKHGRDLRDYLADHVYADLHALYESSPVIASSSAKPNEAETDPHRLARLVLAKYYTAADTGDALVYWRGDWWRWTGTHYAVDSVLQARVVEVTKAEFDRLNLEIQEEDPDKECHKVTGALISNVMLAMSALAALPDEAEHNSWLTRSDGRIIAWERRSLFAVKSGLLEIDELASGRPDVTPHTPLWFSPTAVDYDLDFAAECPRWLAFIDHNLEGDDDRIKILQEWAGYLLTPDNDQQRFLVLEGEGSNGKSAYCAAIEAMLGSRNVSHIPLESFGERFAMADTLGKLLNSAMEIGEIDKAAEGLLKSFVSGDTMMFERKFKDARTAVPTARLMFATNNRPRFADKSSGLWRRMILMPFRVRITEDEKVLGMDKPAWWDRSGELPGILNWAIDGRRRLNEQGRFTTSKVCTDAIQDYQLEVNPARAFLAEAIEAWDQGRLAISDLYSRYVAWCKESGYKPLGERQLCKEVVRMYPNIKKDRDWKNSGKATFFGVTFSTSISESGA